jgi:hypothetical protein
MSRFHAIQKENMARICLGFHNIFFFVIYGFPFILASLGPYTFLFSF